jgi:HEAT repeat protein
MRQRLSCIEEYIAGLGSANWDLSFKCQERLIRALKRLRKSRPLAVDRLIAATTHPDPQIRFRTVWALASTRCQRAYPTILVLARDPDEDVAYDAVMALGRFGYVQAIEPLIEFIRRSPLEGAIDSAAAHSLCRIGSRSIPPLVELLKSEKPAVRSMAAITLGGIPDPTVIAPLAGLLTDTEERVRVDAAEALGQVGEKSATIEAQRCLDHLSRCLNDPSAEVKRCARYWIDTVRKTPGASAE